MKLYDGGALALIIFVTFGFFTNALYKASDDGTKGFTWEEVYDAASGGIEPPLLDQEWYKENTNQ